MDLAELRGETAGGHTPFPANDRDSYCTAMAVSSEACFLQLRLALQWCLTTVEVTKQVIGPLTDICATTPCLPKHNLCRDSPCS